MTDRDIVVYAAGRASDDTFFLGHDLREYRELAELDEEGLAKFLDCSRGALVSLALCRRPDPNGPSFRANVEQIALPRQEQDDGGPDRSQPDHEHHQVLDLVPRVQLLERVNNCLTEQRGIFEFNFCAHIWISWK